MCNPLLSEIALTFCVQDMSLHFGGKRAIFCMSRNNKMVQKYVGIALMPDILSGPRDNVSEQVSELLLVMLL